MSGPNPSVIRWLPLARAAALRHAADLPSILAVIHIESSGNPRAVSKSDCRGLMQLKPRFFLKPGEGVEILFDPEVNIDRGTEFFSGLRRKWGTSSKAAAAYFGQLTSDGQIKTSRDNPSGISGSQYVYKFWRAWKIYEKVQ